MHNFLLQNRLQHCIPIIWFPDCFGMKFLVHFCQESKLIVIFLQIEYRNAVVYILAGIHLWLCTDVQSVMSVQKLMFGPVGSHGLVIWSPWAILDIRSTRLSGRLLSTGLTTFTAHLFSLVETHFCLDAIRIFWWQWRHLQDCGNFDNVDLRGVCVSCGSTHHGCPDSRDNGVGVC